MSVASIISEYWPFIFLGIPLLILWLNIERKHSIGGHDLSEQRLILEYGFYLLIIAIIQKYVFPDNKFFTIGVIVFLPIIAVFVNAILKKDDVYVLESTVQNELFYTAGEHEKLFSESTRQRFLVMDKGFYDTFGHVGEMDPDFWKGTSVIKFADYVDEKSKTMHHPGVKNLHNISMAMMIPLLLKLKEDLPKLRRENIRLTWLSDYKLAHEQDVIKDKFIMSLKALKDQYDHDPFDLYMTRDEIHEYYEKVRKDAATKAEAEAVKNAAAVTAGTGDTGASDSGQGE